MSPISYLNNSPSLILGGRCHCYAHFTDQGMDCTCIMSNSNTITWQILSGLSVREGGREWTWVRPKAAAANDPGIPGPPARTVTHSHSSQPSPMASVTCCQPWPWHRSLSHCPEWERKVELRAPSSSLLQPLPRPGHFLRAS